MPALGAVVWSAGKTKGFGAVGLRKFRGTAPVTFHDKWHIGSCTKSMTATLVATFVEEGALTWETTVGEVLGKKMEMRPEYRDVTLRMLLSHRSGIRGEVPPPLWAEKFPAIVEFSTFNRPPFQMPPPRPTARFPLTVLFKRVVVPPAEKMPPARPSD